MLLVVYLSGAIIKPVPCVFPVNTKEDTGDAAAMRSRNTALSMEADAVYL